MQNLTTIDTIPGLQRPDFLSRIRPGGGRFVAAAHQAGQRVRGLSESGFAAVAVLAGGVAGAGLALDPAETEAAGLQLGSRVAH